jgi:site-specific DNA recombinase
MTAPRTGRTAEGSFDQLDFAFYGRVSTEDNQDPESSRGWQLTRATALVRPRRGRIVEEFFDIGKSRSLPWQRRPEASRLLAALRNPQRGFTAVVVGEPHRAFYGNQFGLTVPLFQHYRVQLWVPEIGGPFDPDNEAHELVMSVYGGMSKGERNRIKIRVRTAMASQTRLEGRYLGGRPPYGYALQDLGPHPNPAKASDGRRLHGLTPHPETAPVVRRIFSEFVSGNGLFAIAEGLTRDNIPCPSAHDPGRNRHRSGIAWAKGAVRVILINPRYTGYQVWNKQRHHEVLLDVDDVAMGHTSIIRWNDHDEWIHSDKPAHEPIINVDTFAEAQEILSRRGSTRGGEHRQHRTRHPYILRGSVLCGVCQRRMQGQHSHGVAYYRCRFPVEYALANRVDHPRNVILREDVVIPPLDAWLSDLFAPDRRDAVIAEMAAVAAAESPVPVLSTAAARTKELDTKLARYRAALDAGADPVLVSGWITEVQEQRARIAAEPRPEPRHTPEGLTAEQIIALLDDIGDILTALADADPRDKAQVYRQLGLRLTFGPDTQTARAEIDLGARRWNLVRDRGGT